VPKLDVVVLAGTQVEAGAACDFCVMIAAHLESVAQSDTLGGVGGQGEGCESGEGCDESANCEITFQKHIPQVLKP